VRVLVTGSSGFSGSYVAEGLADAGHEVFGLFRRETGFLARLHAQGAVRLVRADLSAASTLAGPFDVVVHAGATSPGNGVTTAALVRDNVGGIQALLDAAVVWRTRAFIFFSSMSVYGEISRPMVDETCPIVNPDIYGVTKQIGEALLAERSHALPGLALRLPGILGPGAHRNWLSGAAASFRRGDTIRAFHLDSPFNNAVHVGDLVRFIQHLIERRWTGYDAMVLGARGTITVRTALERLASGLGCHARIEAAPAAKPSFILSCSHAVDRWGYDPMEIGILIERYGRESAQVDSRVQH
jgi:UDP-glucose 4-epimerase